MNSKPGVTRSLHRAVDLLRLLSTHTQIGWRLCDLASESGLDPATVHRLLAAMCRDGLAMRLTGTRHYSLGRLAYELGVSASPYFDIGAGAEQRLLALAHQLKGCLVLQLRSDAESLCVARHDGPEIGHSFLLQVGGRRPLCQTAGGVAILIGLPPSEQAAIVVRNERDVLQRDRARLGGVRSMLQRSREAGFGLNLGDVVPNICAVSVAIPGHDGLPAASLSVALSVSTLAPSRIEALRQKLSDEKTLFAPLLDRLRL